MSSVGDATTVVDGHAATTSYHAHGNGKVRHYEEGAPLKKPLRELSAANFATAVDYMEEERPFFVKIGKDGLIGALQKLDRQLRNVSEPFSCCCAFVYGFQVRRAAGADWVLAHTVGPTTYLV